MIKTEQAREGLVIKNYGGFYYVQDAERSIYACRPRGKVQQRILSGDRVSFTPLAQEQGVLEAVLPRRNELYRPRVANVSRVLVVMAHQRPQPDLSLLDRLLVLAEYNHISPVIVLNKSDLLRDESVAFIEQYYPTLGYPVIAASSRHSAGIEAIKKEIIGEIAVLSGPSGAGKSSLLRTISDQQYQPLTQELSRKIDRGRHTTRHTELFPLSQGGWLVDTPGFSRLNLPPMRREELRDYMPELKQWGEDCRFGDCLHDKESDCAVQGALQSGQVARSRYDNYLTMLQEVINEERKYR